MSVGPWPESSPWVGWKPREVATLCFVIRDGEILLIQKKRGLGAGKVNGPGGRLEPGETALQAAVRETEEELMVTPTGLSKVGDLHFQFVDGYSLTCIVFTATGCVGVATETDEAVPMWTPLDEIPFDQMWADDVWWLPGAIRGERFAAFFEFDSDQMLSKEIFWLDRDA